MKITKIEFKRHQLFNNHTILFTSPTVPVISFLVGNNGSGKTKVLDAIFDALTVQFKDTHDHEIDLHVLLNAEEQVASGTTVSEVVFTKKRQGGSNSLSTKDNQGNPVNADLTKLFKVVFSTVEINFSANKIESVTSKNIDEEDVPKNISLNLSVEIPQLLIDISNLDDADRGKWYENVKGKTFAGTIPDNIGTRMQRFTDAFHKIYAGSKTFYAIQNKDNAKRIVFKDSNGAEVGLNDLSTGEKQIIYRVGYILRNMANIKGGIILIDEPEISLHPVWQLRLKDFLHEVFGPYDVQIIVATHSPYIFRNLDEAKEQCIKIDRSIATSQKVSLIFPGVPFNPTVNLITYLAYGIVTEMLHVELYTLLQIREHRDKITNSPGRNDGIENWLQDPAGGNIPIRQTFTRTGRAAQTNETIMTWIRNKIHHADELARPQYSQQDLKDSIDLMIGLLQNP